MVQVQEIKEELLAASSAHRRSTSHSPRRRSSKPKTNADYIRSSRPEHVHAMVLSMLKLKTFIGTYAESRYVKPLGDYRDVIRVEPTDGIVPLLGELEARITAAFPALWPGITLPGGRIPSAIGHCFWVEMPQKVYEPHQFRIDDIRFNEREVCFVLRAEQRYQPEDDNTLHARSDESIADVLNDTKDNLERVLRTGAQRAWELLTWENCKNTATFLFVLLCALGTGGVYLMDYALRLLRELTNLLHVLTPSILKLLDIVQKVIGACFILAATIWRDLVGRPAPPPQPKPPKYITYR